jgi:hypothetical protein
MRGLILVEEVMVAAGKLIKTPFNPALPLVFEILFGILFDQYCTNYQADAE